MHPIDTTFLMLSRAQGLNALLYKNSKPIERLMGFISYNFLRYNHLNEDLARASITSIQGPSWLCS